MDKKLKKIVILAYYFPPSNFVGGQRIFSWAKDLNLVGYYPVIITRQWNKGQKDIVDAILKNELEIEYSENYEVHRLPYERTLRDRFSNYKSLKYFQKVLTLFELVLSNFFIRIMSFSNFYSYSKKVLDENPEIKILIASGRPFTSFHIAYRLKRKFPRISWIPDYRDEWTTHSKYNRTGVLNKFIYFLEKRSEKKWTSNSFAFITVSNSLVESIKSIIKKEGISISNGHNSDEKIPTNAKTVLKDKIVFSYLGTMYEYQPIERVINAFKAISDNKKLKFVFQFYGIELIPSVKLKIQELIVGYDNVFVLKDKVNKKELRKIQQNSNFLFLTNYNGIDDWLVVKLLDYSVTGIPIVLFPSDNGVMSNYIKTTNTGFSFNSEQELNCFIDEIVKNTNIELKINTSELEKYSSKKQLEQLSVLLNKINHD